MAAEEICCLEDLLDFHAIQQEGALERIKMSHCKFWEPTAQVAVAALVPSVWDCKSTITLGHPQMR